MQDPKLNLGSAAIQSNIEYYQAKKLKARQEYKLARLQEKQWQQKLKELDAI